MATKSRFVAARFEPEQQRKLIVLSLDAGEPGNMSAGLRLAVDRAAVPHTAADAADHEITRDYIADLRSQVAHANRWRDNEIIAANEARAEAAEGWRQVHQAEAEAAALRRQLEQAQAEIDDVPTDAIQRYMQHSDALAAVDAGRYDAGEGMLDVYLINDWLASVADVAIAADTPHRPGKGDTR